ncbi:hypothetical protein SRB5_36910 [Streptomyces sp. RB5]|uniref:NAD-dependent epimerase/dehydratase domain-containing protein n=1 Tax=Streptomyces smaragdinus TaxID=2585196 RepID=A0A7K0CJN6_9ACTN|nr:NAD-dependent epimerase/dehydratase family protein [Streptomyces smaragdinus]MQY13543.1 hypothetical protein [Streptomyces smaragdinus]
MRVAVAGATGLVGSATVTRLREHDVEVVPLSRRTGTDLLTGEGLDEALRGVHVVVDATDSALRTGEAASYFFRRATANLLASGAAAGVAHHVVASMVGAGPKCPGYFGAKGLQEEQVRRSVIPHSIVRAAPSFEAIEAMVLADTDWDILCVPPALTRPLATDDVATALAHVAVGLPLFGALDVAGPEGYRLDDFVGKLLAARGDAREVVADERTGMYDTVLEEYALLPDARARLGRTTFDQWLARV